LGISAGRVYRAEGIGDKQGELLLYLVDWGWQFGCSTGAPIKV
jgi:hypothetical protein